MNTHAASGERVLIVTTAPERFFAERKNADIVSEAASGMEAASANLYAAIFCDMGTLADGGNGIRFVTRLVKARAFVPVYLMVESLATHSAAVAKHYGAAGVIHRDHTELRDIIKGLASAKPATYLPVVAVDVPEDWSIVTAEKLEQIIEGLKKEIGPTAKWVVESSLHSIAVRYSDNVPVNALMKVVTRHIDDANLRELFARRDAA